MAVTAALVLELLAVENGEFDGQLVTMFTYVNDDVQLTFHAHPSKHAWLVRSRGIGIALATCAIAEFSRLVDETDCLNMLQSISQLKIPKDGGLTALKAVNVLRI